MTSAPIHGGRRDRWLFLGSGLLLISVLVFGLAREQRWGQPMVQLRLVSSDATGLRPGQEVRISGIPVGRVGALHLQPNAAVAVEVHVWQRYAALIGPGSLATQGQDGLVGDHYLAISADPQTAGRRLPRNGQPLRYEQPLALAPLLQQLLQTQRELQATLRNTTQLTGSDLPKTLRDARRSLGSLHSLAGILQQETASTAPELRQTLRQISRTGSNAETTSSQAQQLLKLSQPALIHTLEDIQQLTRTSERFLQILMGVSGQEQNASPKEQP